MRAFTYLSSRADIMLIDEEPERITTSLPAEVLRYIQPVRIPFWSDRASLESLSICLKEMRPDWIVVDNPGVLIKCLQVLRYSRKHLGAKVQLTLHSGMLTKTVRRRVLELVSSFALLELDRITCVSEYTKRYWQIRYPWTRLKTFTVLHNGVGLPDVRAREATSPLRIGFVGRLDSEKDPRLFGKLAALAGRRNPDFQFHVFGDGPLEKELGDEFGTVMKLHGHVEDLDGIYRNLEVLAVTSPVENCPYTVLEAKSYGVPTVASRIGGMPEIVIHNEDGFLCRRRDVAEFLQGLRVIKERYVDFNLGCLSNRDRFSLASYGSKMWGPLLTTEVS